MYEVETSQMSVLIEDLGLVVRMGVSLWLTPDQVEKSMCLKHLQMLGKVRITPGKPSRTSAPVKRAIAQRGAKTRKLEKSWEVPPKVLLPKPTIPAARVVREAPPQKMTEEIVALEVDLDSPLEVDRVEAIQREVEVDSPRTKRKYTKRNSTLKDGDQKGSHESEDEGQSDSEESGNT